MAHKHEHICLCSRASGWAGQFCWSQRSLARHIHVSVVSCELTRQLCRSSLGSLMCPGPWLGQLGWLHFIPCSSSSRWGQACSHDEGRGTRREISQSLLEPGWVTITMSNLSLSISQRKSQAQHRIKELGNRFHLLMGRTFETHCKVYGYSIEVENQDLPSNQPFTASIAPSFLRSSYWNIYVLLCSLVNVCLPHPTRL